jgi:hypothetical protein
MLFVHVERLTFCFSTFITDYLVFSTSVVRCFHIHNNNNNQAFYSQASWGRLEIKSHEPKNRDKTRAKKKGGKQRAIKNQIENGENAIKR